MTTSENPGASRTGPAPACRADAGMCPQPPLDHADGLPMPPAADRPARPSGRPGPVGQIRPTGLTILLFFFTLGIWRFVCYSQVHEELERHSGEGLGGLARLVLAFGLVPPFLLGHEVGSLYSRAGREPPVTA